MELLSLIFIHYTHNNTTWTSEIGNMSRIFEYLLERCILFYTRLWQYTDCGILHASLNQLLGAFWLWYIVCEFILAIGCILAVVYCMWVYTSYWVPIGCGILHVSLYQLLCAFWMWYIVCEFIPSIGCGILYVSLY